VGWGLRTGGIKQCVMREVSFFQSYRHALVRSGPLVLGIPWKNRSEESDDRPTMTQKQKRKNVDRSGWRETLQQERGTRISRQPMPSIRIQSALSPRSTAAHQKQNEKDVDRSERCTSIFHPSHNSLSRLSSLIGIHWKPFSGR